jgi:menaquinone-dependent protoporphyrinogen oxidase
MSRILIAYGTTEGQTAKIAHHIADAGRELGHIVDAVHAADLAHVSSLDEYSAAMLGASLHEGRYQRDVAELIKSKSAWLSAHPSAFFSVSLGAASSDPHEVTEVERIMHDFLEHNGWKPGMTASFAGALKYTQYNWLKRALMKHISKKEGGATDTSRDYEYTDWAAVTTFAKQFFAGASR